MPATKIKKQLTDEQVTKERHLFCDKLKERGL